MALPKHLCRCLKLMLWRIIQFLGYWRIKNNRERFLRIIHCFSMTITNQQLAMRHGNHMICSILNLEIFIPYCFRIPTFGIRAWAALFCVGGRNAGGYGCNSRVLGRPLYIAYMYIDSYSFLPVTSSVIVTCTYRFTADDNHLQKSTILSSAMSLYRSLSGVPGYLGYFGRNKISSGGDLSHYSRASLY